MTNVGGARSGIRDNHTRGSAASFIEERVGSAASLSIVSAYFTAQAYDSLKVTLDAIAEARFLFGEPCFLSGLDNETLDPPTFALT